MKKISIIDGYNLIYRLFYAVPPFTTKAGEPVNAVFGVAKTLIGLHNYEKPDILIFAMDTKGGTFRETLYPDYKGTRDRMPDDLRSQETRIFELLDTMEIPMVLKEGFEADDIIGTLVTELRKDPENQISILSGDKDLYQFIGGNVTVYDTMKRKIADREAAIEKFGVPPERVVDFLSITGDSSDNIPGIPGFGPKKAQSLIGALGTLEEIYDAVDREDPGITGKTRDTLIASREVAFLSKKLVTIDTAVEFDFDIKNHEFKSRSILGPRVFELFRLLEFRSLLSEAPVELRDFSSLGVDIIDINTPQELDSLLQDIRSLEKVALALHLEGGNIRGVALSLSDTKVHYIDTVVLPVGSFFQSILNSDIELIGYDIKSDLKKIRAYLENTQDVATDQMMIF